jgi:hypothetical protein
VFPRAQWTGYVRLEDGKAVRIEYVVLPLFG